MLFKSTINVYSPVRHTRNLDLSLFLIYPILELVSATTIHKSEQSNMTCKIIRTYLTK
jgi:hypothetical protein